MGERVVPSRLLVGRRRVLCFAVRLIDGEPWYYRVVVVPTRAGMYEFARERMCGFGLGERGLVLEPYDWAAVTVVWSRHPVRWELGCVLVSREVVESASGLVVVGHEMVHAIFGWFHRMGWLKRLHGREDLEVQELFALTHSRLVVQFVEKVALLGGLEMQSRAA